MCAWNRSPGLVQVQMCYNTSILPVFDTGGIEVVKTPRKTLEHNTKHDTSLSIPAPVQKPYNTTISPRRVTSMDLEWKSRTCAGFNAFRHFNSTRF